MPEQRERCWGCERGFDYPHLCRVHHLCGICHPKYDETLRKLDEVVDREAAEMMRDRDDQ
ncbi:MAG: hypothetical protein ACOH10_07835 [Rhodoglobus sp.]